MPVVELDTLTANLDVHPRLLKSILDGVESALAMCGASARCVGFSSLPLGDSGYVTGLIGVHGKVSGFVTVSMSERFALQAVGGLLQDEFSGLSAQVVDGVGEITNLIVGGVKSSLAGTPWAFPIITVPSVIVGSGYQISYAKGLDFLSVAFEHNDPDAVLMPDRLLQVNLSLLRLQS